MRLLVRRKRRSIFFRRGEGTTTRQQQRNGTLDVGEREAPSMPAWQFHLSSFFCLFVAVADAAGAAVLRDLALRASERSTRMHVSCRGYCVATFVVV